MITQFSNEKYKLNYHEEGAYLTLIKSVVINKINHSYHIINNCT